MNNADVTLQNQRLQITGQVGFANIMSVYTKSLPLLEKLTRYDIDLSMLTSSNSASLALLIEWVKQAHKSQKEIRFFSIPADLAAIATVAGLGKLITSL